MLAKPGKVAAAERSSMSSVDATSPTRTPNCARKRNCSRHVSLATPTHRWVRKTADFARIAADLPTRNAVLQGTHSNILMTLQYERGELEAALETARLSAASYRSRARCSRSSSTCIRAAR
jgi:hypothetical protein